MRALSAFLLAGLFHPVLLSACIWDSDTIEMEKKKSPEIAALIHGEPARGDTSAYTDRIRKLKAAPWESDPEWLNELAGAYLRSGDARAAAELLEPAVNRFPDNYGIHANLGTAYHLLGRYRDAERHIARDLEINPDAHFSLEKYHLALLQYLIRDEKYQSRHVYVDEFSEDFAQAHGSGSFQREFGVLIAPTNVVTREEVVAAEALYEDVLKRKGSDRYALSQALTHLIWLDEPPAYRTKWDLGADPKFEEGVIYMASLNPRQPACFVMLGVVCWKNRNLNLAAAAFEKAIALDSPQSELLKIKVAGIRQHTEKAAGNRRTELLLAFLPVSIALVCILILWALLRWGRRMVA